MFEKLRNRFQRQELPKKEAAPPAAPAEPDWEFTIEKDVLKKARGKAKTVVIPQEVKHIGDKAFECCFNLERVYLPKGLQTIGEYAFFSCSKLVEIQLPRGLEEIGQCAFYGCRALSRLNVPDSVIRIGRLAFYDCEALTDLRLPKRIKPVDFNIKDGVLLEYVGIREAECLVIPEYVTEIKKIGTGSGAKKIILPQGLKVIGPNAFDYCFSLEEVEIPSGVQNIGNSAFSDCTRLRRVTLPDGLTTLPSYIFRKCKRLEQIVLPEGIREIGYRAFFECQALREIRIPPNVKIIGSDAFRDCKNLSGVNFPEGLREIGYYAFHGTKLERVELPDTVEEISFHAFSRCAELKFVKLPANLKEIGECAFGGCAQLQTVEIPEGIRMLPQGIFSGCPQLRRVVIPDSVTEINRYAFTGCRLLEEVECREPERFEMAFLDTPFWQKLHPEQPAVVRLPLDLVGNRSGKLLRERGYLFFEEDRDYHIRLPGEDGVVEVSAWSSEDGPDEDGFGREDYYDHWLLDEALEPLPGIHAWYDHSSLYMRSHEKEWVALREQAARKIKEKYGKA